jgi:hypothetical protein
MSSLSRILNLGRAWLRFRSRPRSHPGSRDPVVMAELERDTEATAASVAAEAAPPRLAKHTSGPVQAVEPQPSFEPSTRDVTEGVVMDGDRAVLKRL